jgi:hypothetical protein
MVGLANVDNTTDANKPVSTATQTALDLKASLASPTFTGTVGGITKSMVGLSNVDNTTDANKPVSTATQTALDLKASLASPTFTGTVAAPTPTAGDNSTKVATTAFVTSTMEATTVDIGSAGTSNGNGVRIGNARFTINKPTTPSTGNSSVTLTNTQVLEAGIFVGTSTSNSRTIKIPKANGSTGLVKALPNATVGDIITVLIVNGGDKTISIDGDDSTVTKVPNTMNVPAGTSRVVYIRVTDITNDSEKISIY